MPMLSELDPSTVFRVVDAGSWMNGAIGVTPDEPLKRRYDEDPVLGVLIYSPRQPDVWGYVTATDREVEIIPGGIRFEGLD